MPRPLRLQLASATYHVTAHSIRGCDVYRDDDDRATFSAILGTLMRRRRWVCTGYCFMSNHYHLVVQTPEPDLAAGMQWLNGAYAASFNKKYAERGHLFRERYRSKVVRSEAHFVELYSYLPLNPVKAGMARRPEDYPWSSYGALLGVFPAPQYLSVDRALAPFGRNPTAARAVLRALVEARLVELEQLVAA
jgi:REP element-mobilizing transposase RayT